MKANRKSLAILIFTLALTFLPANIHASPSEHFFREDVHVYDNWGIFRTRATGSNGFLGITSASHFDPLLAYESLGADADLAWQLGQKFTELYPDANQRAEKIFTFVRDRVRYTSDSDQFGSAEFAQNADEVAATIKSLSLAKGDCEDSSILLAVIYKSAGYRSALALMPGHVATLVYLPDYRKSAHTLKLAGEAGWVWAEATGDTNRLGWVPTSLVEEGVIAKEITHSDIANLDTTAPAIEVEFVTRSGGSSATTATAIFLGSVGFLWITGGTRRRNL